MTICVLDLEIALHRRPITAGLGMILFSTRIRWILMSRLEFQKILVPHDGHEAGGHPS